MSEQVDRRAGWMDHLSRHWGRADEAVEPTSEQSAIFSILQKMTARIRGNTPLSELLSTMAMNVCHALSTEIALVRVLDPEHEVLSVRGLFGVPPHLVGSVLGERTNATDTFRELRPGSLITFTPDRPLVLQHASALVADEIQHLKKLGAVHILILPLHHRGQLLGRLDLLRLRNEAFSVEDGTIANVLATLIAGVIYGPPDQEEAERYDRIIDASFAFQQSIEPLADVGEMLQNIVEAIRRIIKCDRCYGLLWNEARREFSPTAVAGADAELVDRLKQIALSPTMIPALGQLFTSDRPLLIGSEQHPELLPPAVAEALGCHAVVLVPLQGRREPLVGALMLDFGEPEPQFSNRDLAVLSIVAPHAAMMVENALLFEEVKRSSERLALVNDIGIELASLTDLAGLFAQVHLHVASVLNASRFCMGLVLPDGDFVEYRYAVNDDIAEHPVVHRLGDDPLSQAIRTKQPVMVNSRDPLDSSTWFPPAADITPSEAMLVVPILVGHRSIGVISAQSESRGVYTKHDLDLLATIGMQTGVAIENARLYTMVQARVERRAYLLDQVLTRQEAERKTIAEDIHNDTLQTLASCLYSIDLIGRRVTQLTPEETQEELCGVRDNLAENIDRLRQIIFQIRPSTLDILGLEPALREHAKYVENDTGIEISLDVDLDERPSSEMETAIYRIAQETIAHMRHRAGVSHIVVRIRRRGDTIIVTIADNGEPLSREGLEEENGNADGGLPGEPELRLITLKERVELAGGQLHTASLPSGGATLQILLPIRSGP